MPRRHRTDHPGAWWHVYNRGANGKLIFHHRADYRLFMALLAVAARRRWIEIHAFCLMPNHFHLLVRSPNGDLAKAMRWVENMYALRFNARYGVTGPLFGGRYKAKLIRSLTYRKACFHYVHDNPLPPALAPAPEAYMWSSAPVYAGVVRRCWVRRRFGERAWAARRRRGAPSRELVATWLADPRPDRGTLDKVLRMSTRGVEVWLRRQLGGVTQSMRVIVLPATVDRARLAIEAEFGDAGTVANGPGRGVPRSDLVLAGLLRGVCGLSLEKCGEHLGASITTVRARVRAYRYQMAADGRVGQLAARVFHRALRWDYEGEPVGRLEPRVLTEVRERAATIGARSDGR